MNSKQKANLYYEKGSITATAYAKDYKDRVILSKKL